jgi:hypothetical protein
MLPQTALKAMNVMFATPCYISAVSMNYVTSIFGLTLDSAHLGLRCILHMHSESLITRGRNNIVAEFLRREEFTHLFWIDSDITFDSASVFRLLQADRDVAAGIYPIKAHNWPREGLPAGMTQREFEIRYASYPFNPIKHGALPVGPFADEHGFIEVDEAPTGFMCIKRNVFYRMMQHYPQLNYRPYGPATGAKLHWLFFDCMVDPDSRYYLSEDYAFCRRWRDMGGKVWADANSRLQHLGQHQFAGELKASLVAQGRW